MRKRSFIFVIIAILALVVSSGCTITVGGKDIVGGGSDGSSTAQVEPGASSEPQSEQQASDSPSATDTAAQYTLTAGNYIAGIDIPAGTCNVSAVSGTGYISSSNLLSGGINEVFGIDDGSGTYTSSFDNLTLSEDAMLTLNGNLTVALSYSELMSDISGRTYDDAAAIDLEPGNYAAGTDFPAGTYKIVLNSGNGNVSSDNLYDGGINEIFGEDDGSGLYITQFMNAMFTDGTTLTLSGVSVKLIPAN